MEITLSTGNINGDEAAGLVALLVEIFGEEILPASDNMVISGEPLQPVNLAGHVHVTAEPATTTEALNDPVAAFGAGPQSVPAAPAPAGTTPSAPTAGTLNVDANGFVWDERIHSGSKALNQDGTWRYRKGIGNDVKASVENELRQGVPSPQPVAPSAPVAPVAPPPPSSTQAPAPPPAAQPAPSAPAPLPGGASGMTALVPLLQLTGKLQQDGRVTLPQITEMAQLVGAEAGVSIALLADLRNHPTLIPAFKAKLAEAIGEPVP